MPTNSQRLKKVLIDQYTTTLAPQEESQFKNWANKTGIHLEPGWNEDYDMRGLWKSNPNYTPDSRGHFPDLYKKPNHPTFSNESVYATPDAPRWFGKLLINNQGKVIADETEPGELNLPNLPYLKSDELTNIFKKIGLQQTIQDLFRNIK